VGGGYADIDRSHIVTRIDMAAESGFFSQSRFRLTRLLAYLCSPPRQRHMRPRMGPSSASISECITTSFIICRRQVFSNLSRSLGGREN
jgi:hypothetical protein